MLCERCKKNPATFHKSIIINGKGYETNLCSECARLVNFDDDINFDTDFGFNGFAKKFDLLEKNFFNDFFNDDDFFTPTMLIEKNNKYCPECKSTFYDFVRRGKLGCNKCYDTFESEIRDMLENMDNPMDLDLNIIETQNKPTELDKLNDEFNKAIADERYEDAGEIKKKINEIRNNELKGDK